MAFELIKVSELPELTTPSDSNVIPIQDGDYLKRISFENLKEAVTDDVADDLAAEVTAREGAVSGEATARGNADTAILADLASPYSASATYAAGDYCTKDGQLYRCTTAISTAEAWTAAHWSAVALGGDVSTLRNALNAEADNTKAYVRNLISDFTWMSNKSFDLTNGNIKSQSNYNATYRVVGDDFTTQFNYETIATNTSTSFVVLWKDNVYVGYYHRKAYRNPSGQTISKPSYDEWALSAHNDNKSTFHLYSLTTEINALDVRTQELVTDFVWSVGYYAFQTGVVNTSAYRHTEKVYGSQYSFADSTIYDANTNNFISFWYQGAYVGYLLAGKYYNPSQTQVESLTYDQWAVNIYNTSAPYTDLKPTSVDSRLDALESREGGSRYDHLNGLKIGFLGDSITNGVGASESAKTYVNLMKAEFGSSNVINYGINGSLIASSSSAETSANPMSVRYANMSNDLDVVVVYGGTNDWYYGTAWGTEDSTDTDTFLGALNVLMSGLVEKYCGKEIFFVTPMSSAYSNQNTDNANPATGKTMLDYRNAIIEKARYHAIPVIDLYGMCGMDVAHNADNKTYYSADGVHPNDAGHKRVHDRIVTFISNTLY